MLIDLKDIITEKKMSLGQIEYKSKVSKSVISKIQNGKMIPRADHIYRLAIALNMEPAELYKILVAGEPWTK